MKKLLNKVWTWVDANDTRKYNTFTIFVISLTIALIYTTIVL